MAALLADVRYSWLVGLSMRRSRSSAASHRARPSAHGPPQRQARSRPSQARPRSLLLRMSFRQPCSPAPPPPDIPPCRPESASPSPPTCTLQLRQRDPSTLRTQLPRVRKPTVESRPTPWLRPSSGRPRLPLTFSDHIRPAPKTELLAF